MKMEADVVIVGTGVGGLFSALSLPRDQKIIMITKSDLESSDSFLAQGGICMLHDKDDYDSYFEDTMKAGHYENRKESVDLMIRSSREIIHDLIGYGVDFQKQETDESGNEAADNGGEKAEIQDIYAFTREGAHSRPRILFHADITGKEITSKLLAQVKQLSNVTLLEYTTMTDIIVENDECKGILAQDKDGNIYVTYDKGRYIEKEIRITKFTEQDIMNGKITSEGSVVRMAVSILGDQKDIESVSTEFTKAITVEHGTLLSTARKDLPTTIKVKDKDGNEYTLSGKWGTEDYDAEKAGTYTLTFSATTDMLRYKLFDAHNLLQVAVTVKGNGSGGNSGCAGAISAGAIGGLLLAGAIILTRKNKNKNYKEDKR